MIKPIVPFVFFSLLTLACNAQFQEADKKMNTIDSFRKFKTERSGNDELTKMTAGDSSIRVLELTTYSNKKAGFTRVVQRSRYQGTEVKRTCYFTKADKLFAIRDSIWYDNHTTRQLTYYLNNSTLLRAIDGQRQDVTERINQSELINWIRNMFEE